MCVCVCVNIIKGSLRQSPKIMPLIISDLLTLLKSQCCSEFKFSLYFIFRSIKRKWVSHFH